METNVVEINNVEIQVVESENTFLVSNREVALAYGISDSNVRSHKSNGEFKKGVHFKDTLMDTNGGNQKQTMWTKRGIIRLGFRLRETSKTIAFRDWAEDFIINGNAQKPKSQIELIIESAQALQAVDNRLQVLEHKVADIEVNKEVKPKGGFASINELHLKSGFSKDVVKIMIDKCKPKNGSAMKTLPDGSVKPYTTYKIKTVMKYAKLVRGSAISINPNGHFYRSPMLGKIKFQMK